jgi:hypothetical protein
VFKRPVQSTGWRSWVFTVDHKKLGIMYGVVAMIFFIIGGVEALNALAESECEGRGCRVADARARGEGAHRGCVVVGDDYLTIARANPLRVRDGRGVCDAGIGGTSATATAIEPRRNAVSATTATTEVASAAATTARG